MTQPFEIRPVPTSGDRIRELNRQAEFMASKRVDREYAPAKWEYERGRLVEDLLDWKMRGGRQ